MWFDLTLKTADYDEEGEPAGYAEADGEADWGSPVVWQNYHRCSMSSTRWEDTTGLLAATPDRPLRFSNPQPATLTADALPIVDLDADPAFHIYLLGHDSVAGHQVTFTPAAAGGFTIGTSTPKATVVEYFSPPSPYPGPTWTKDGRAVDGQELNSIAGPDHCDWQSAVIMHLGWPLGTVSRSSAEVRQFIRDPDGVIDPSLRNRLAIAIDLAADATDTGYRNGDLELWLSPSTPDAAYLRVGDDVERWPRADPVIACA